MHPPAIILGHDAPLAIILGCDTPPAIILGHDAPSAIILRRDAPPAIILGRDVPTTIILRHDAPPAIILGHDAPPTKYATVMNLSVSWILHLLHSWQRLPFVSHPCTYFTIEP